MFEIEFTTRMMTMSHFTSLSDDDDDYDAP